jgi:magnesium transporter
MLSVFPPAPDSPSDAIWSGAVWIDMLAPDAATRLSVAVATGLHVPTRDELSEIESSSRLSRRGEALYLSMPGLVHTEAGETGSQPVGFVLSPDRLLTVRFARQRAFETYAARCGAGLAQDASSVGLLLGLCETLVDRIADVLEREGEELDGVSRRVFRAAPRRGQPRRAEIELRAMLRTVGRVGDLVSKARDTLLGLGRMIPFVLANTPWITSEQKTRFKTLRADIVSLNDYDSHLAGKVQFLMEAIIGFIGIEQSNIIRVLTVVSVVGVPPTFFASLWGMNYRSMPELDWAWGYPMALGIILLSAVLPIVLFRVRGWL